MELDDSNMVSSRQSVVHDDAENSQSEYALDVADAAVVALAFDLLRLVLIELLIVVYVGLYVMFVYN